MKISQEFPSKYLKAADLQDKDVRVTMASVEKELLGDEKKLILYFKGKDKGLVLNKTNSSTIADAYGDDTDEWFGQDVILFSVMVDFQGKVGPAIRVRPPSARDKVPAGKQAPAPAPAKQELDDEIPF